MRITRSRRALVAGLAATAALTAMSSASAIQGPLHTSGGQIVDQANREVVLQGVNWFGLETANHAPHGLWTRDYRDMLAQIKAQGFNVVRLPFSLQALKISLQVFHFTFGIGMPRLLGHTPRASPE